MTTWMGPRPGLVRRIMMMVAAVILIWAVMAWVGTTVFDRDVTPVSRIVNALLIFGLAVPAVVVARRFVDRRSWATLQLQGWRGAWRPFLIGVVSFLVPSAVGLTVAQLAGWVRITPVLAPFDIVAGVAFTVVTVLLLEAIPEELVFRGYIYRNLSASMAPLAAVFVQAAIFALLGTALWVLTMGWEVFGERATLFLAMGIVLGMLRLVSNSVWNPIGFHLAFQVVAQTLFLHQGVEVDDPGAATLAGIVVGFVFAMTITLVLSRRRPNWTKREPDDQADAPASGRA